MLPWDAPTLLLVDAVLNGFAALFWCLMAGLFRIAPAGSRLIALSHFLLVPALLLGECREAGAGAWGPWGYWQVWVPELSAVAALACLALGVRCLLRLRPRMLDVLLLAGVSAVAVLILGHAQVPRLADGGRAASALGLAALAVLVSRDMMLGGSGLPRGLVLLLGLPAGLLGLANLIAGLALLRGSAAAGLVVSDCRSSAPMAWLWLLLTLWLSLLLVALVLRRLLVRIEALLLSDALTGTLNRRAIEQQLLTLQAQLRRGEPHALVMVDIDNFKRINDSLGHAAGDAALQHVAQVLRSGLRELDHLGRVGGEEFCVLLPQTDLGAAALVAERLRQCVREQAFVWQGSRLMLSASFGVAAGRPQDGAGMAALALADAQLYRAKAEGRDRVCVAWPGLEFT